MGGVPIGINRSTSAWPFRFSHSRSSSECGGSGFAWPPSQMNARIAAFDNHLMSSIIEGRPKGLHYDGRAR
jgi:hypothetical protein